MPSPRNGDSHYYVHLSGAVAEGLRQIQRKAALEGRGDFLVSAVRTIVRRLEVDPFEFGEPLYTLPSLRLHVRSATVRPLIVGYAVCEDLPLVFIRRFGLLPSKP